MCRATQGKRCFVNVRTFCLFNSFCLFLSLSLIQQHHCSYTRKLNNRNSGRCLDGAVAESLLCHQLPWWRMFVAQWCSPMLSEPNRKWNEREWLENLEWVAPVHHHYSKLSRDWQTQHAARQKKCFVRPFWQPSKQSSRKRPRCK